MVNDAPQATQWHTPGMAPAGRMDPQQLRIAREDSSKTFADAGQIGTVQTHEPLLKYQTVGRCLFLFVLTIISHVVIVQFGFSFELARGKIEPSNVREVDV